MSQQINLYNPAFIPAREWVTGPGVAIAVGVLLLALVAGTLWSRDVAFTREQELVGIQGELKTTQAAVESIRQASEARVPNPELVRALATAKADIELRERILSQSAAVIASPVRGYAGYLKALARQTMEGVWITGFRVSGGQGALSLSGRALEKSQLPDYVQRLNREPVFHGQAFGGMRVEAVPFDAPLTFATASGAVSPAPTLPPRAADAPAPRQILAFQLLAKKTDEPTKDPRQ